MKTRNQAVAQSGQRGSILILTLIISGVLTLMSMSFGMAVRNAVEQAREAEPALHAELAAASAMDFTLRRLLLDSDWAGTGEEGVPLVGATSFEVNRELVWSASGDPADETDPTRTYAFTLVGRHGQAEARLEMTVRISSLDPLRDQALAILGGAVDLQHLTVNGNMLITDALDVVEDYIPDMVDPSTGTWELGGVDTLGGFDFDHTEISGSLSKYTNEVYTDGREITIWQTLPTPSWHLEPYLEPGPDRVILENVRTLNNQVYDELVVFVNDPGDQIDIRDCSFRNGIVVYNEPDYDLRGLPRNELYLKKHNFFGAEDSSSHLGILAPATVVRTPGNNGHPPTMIGTTFIHSLDNVMGATISGQLIALNSIEHVMHSTFTYDPDLAQWPPEGFEFGEEGTLIMVLGVREVFPDQEIPVL